jgi:hypothetical protein
MKVVIEKYSLIPLMTLHLLLSRSGDNILGMGYASYSIQESVATRIAFIVT